MQQSQETLTILDTLSFPPQTLPSLLELRPVISQALLCYHGD